MNTTQLAIILDSIPSKGDGKSIIVTATNHHQFEGYLNVEAEISGILRLDIYDDTRSVYIDVAEIISIEGDCPEKE